MTKYEIFTYQGSYEDFEEFSDRYYAQLAFDTHGLAVRDNSLIELISIGIKLERTTHD